MISMPIVSLVTSTCSPGSFNARVQEGELHVPPDLKRVCDTLGIEDSIALVTQLNSAPEAFATELKWTTQDVIKARDGIRNELKNHLPVEVLDPSAFPGVIPLI